MTDRELMQIALKYLEESDNYLGSLDHSKPIAALRNRLAQPEQDGVCRYCDGSGCVACDARCLPRREWVGLTDVERIDLCVISEAVSAHSLIGMVEAKLKEKNA